MTNTKEDKIQIGKEDVLWSYAATFLKIASSLLLLPLILKMMATETVGIWTVFVTITAVISLLDFGFNPSFTRNVTYVFSGVRTLKSKGFSSSNPTVITIDYSLLKGVINAMRWFYLRIALVLFVLLITFGSFYIYTLLKDYKGENSEVYIAWLLLCSINTYNLYTLYYDSLMQGKGLIKRSKQIICIGQTGYLIIASILILSGFGLIAIVTAQLFSVIVVRYLSYRSFFTEELKKLLKLEIPVSVKEILKAIYPNAIKFGLTSVGGALVSRSSILIGSLYLTLEEIASYGITIQLVTVIASLASIYTYTFLPKITQLRIAYDNQNIKHLYLTGQIILCFTFAIGGLLLFYCGEKTLHLIGSQTHLLPQVMLAIVIIVSFLETNHSLAGSILASKNEVPFFKASLISGGFTVMLLLIFFNLTKLGIWSMIAAPALAQVVYQNWKWPYEVFKELKITFNDGKRALRSFSFAIAKNLRNNYHVISLLTFFTNFSYCLS